MPDDPRTSSTEPTSSPRRTVAIVLMLVALGALALVTLGAAADRGELMTYTGGGDLELSTVQQTAEDYSEPDWDTHEVETVEPRADVGRGAVTALLVIASIALVLLAIWVVHRMRRLAEPPPPLAAEVADSEELTVAQARAALDDARARLSSVVDAHDAVIAAWLALERAIAAAGIRRQPTQTTLEYVVAVLASLDLDATSLERLSELYRRALFDDRPLAEADRETALALLDALTAQLEGRTAAAEGSAGGAR